MKKWDKKHLAGISGIFAVLFIAPLIVFAVVYKSNERKNSFAPGSVDIEVQEISKNEQKQGKTLETELKWDSAYQAEKLVKICDKRNNPGEALRVCFIPMWFDKDANGDPANVCNVFDFSTISQPTASNNKLVYTDDTKTITLNLNPEWTQNGWHYQAADGYFYYNGDLNPDDLTETLLSSVQLSEDAYALTASYLFRLDVLADAIQTSGNAAETRRWTPQS